MSANAPQPRTLELPLALVWAREIMAMTTYNNLVLYVVPLWFIKMRCGSHAFLGPQHKNPYFQKSKSFIRLSTKRIFCWHVFSEAPSATATEPNELSPISAGGEGIGRRTPAVVITNTMSNGHRMPCGALGALSSRTQDKASFAFFFLSSRLSGQGGAEPTKAGKVLPLPPSGSETLSNATSQL